MKELDVLTRSFDPIWEWVLDETSTEDHVGYFPCRCWAPVRKVDTTTTTPDDWTIEERLSRTFDELYVDYVEDPVTEKSPLSSLQQPSIPIPVPSMPSMSSKPTLLSRIRSSRKSKSMLDFSAITNALTFDKKRRSFLVLKRT